MPEIILLTESDKQSLAKMLGRVATNYGITIQTCGTNDNYEQYGINKSGCATLEILGNANDCSFKTLKHKGMRQGCHCIESRDIDTYDTCLNGCKYCYANTNINVALDNYKKHNPNSSIILGELNQDDIIIQGNQKTYLNKNIQISLFDDEI